MDYAENMGGQGVPKDEIIYELITDQTIDTEEGYTLTVELYYKTRELREFHGNLQLTTKDVPNFTNIKFGFLWTDNMTGGNYDGLHVETDFKRNKLDSEEHQQDFRGFDIWTDSRPDTIGNGATVIELPLDRKNDFNINPAKSFKQCNQKGECTFNAHFWRYFDTGDPKDFLLDENEDKTFYMLGYFEV